MTDLDDKAEVKAVETARWFVLRDLRRANARISGFEELKGLGLQVFTPTVTRIVTVRGQRVKRTEPVLRDLLFVYSSRETLDPVIAARPSLQYRFVRGGGYCEPLTVPDRQMEPFMAAAGATPAPRYFMPGEITEDMRGREVRIVGGPLDGYSGRLLSVRGTRRRRLLVEIPGLMAVAAEVMPEFVQLL